MSEDNQTDGRKGRVVSPEQKEAMSQGRTETRIVRHYLEAVEGTTKSGGRRRSRETLEKRLAKVEAQLGEAEPVARLKLVQQRIDLTKQIDQADSAVDMEQLEGEFISIAASYSERNGISYQAWREFGVDAKVLRAAGVR